MSESSQFLSVDTQVPESIETILELKPTFLGFLQNVESQMKEMPGQVDLPVIHRFSPETKAGSGTYLREIFMPKGTLALSKEHTTEHFYVVLSGVATVWDQNMDRILVKGPCVGITKPGTQRLLYIHEDMKWICVHSTSETDLKKIEDMLILNPKVATIIQTEKVEELVN